MTGIRASHLGVQVAVEQRALIDARYRAEDEAAEAKARAAAPPVPRVTAKPPAAKPKPVAAAKPKPPPKAAYSTSALPPGSLVLSPAEAAAVMRMIDSHPETRSDR